MSFVFRESVRCAAPHVGWVSGGSAVSGLGCVASGEGKLLGGSCRPISVCPRVNEIVALGAPSVMFSLAAHTEAPEFSLPQVNEMVREIFKKEPNRSMNPDEVRGSSTSSHCI